MRAEQALRTHFLLERRNNLKDPTRCTREIVSQLMSDTLECQRTVRLFEDRDNELFYPLWDMSEQAALQMKMNESAAEKVIAKRHTRWTAFGCVHFHFFPIRMVAKHRCHRFVP